MINIKNSEITSTNYKSNSEVWLCSRDEVYMLRCIHTGDDVSAEFGGGHGVPTTRVSLAVLKKMCRAGQIPVGISEYLYTQILEETKRRGVSPQ